MRGLWKLTWTEMKLFLREPMATFFTLGFPLMILFLFGSIWGNERADVYGGFGFVDISVPGYTGVIIASTGLIAVAVSMATYREKGILRRLRATPLRPQTVLGAQIMVFFALTAFGMVLLVIAGVVVFGLRFAGNPISVFAGFSLCTLSFFSMGFIVAGLMPTARTAQIVAMVLFYPMIFLCGAFIPFHILPGTVQKFAEFLPLTHVVNLLRGLWMGHGWGEHLTEVAILGGLLVVCVIVSARTFRWE
jgi:ABC-2 type transport system permease protein